MRPYKLDHDSPEYQEYREKERQRSKELKEWCREHHICIFCMKQKADKGYNTCLTCRMENRERNRKYNGKYSDKSHERYYRLKAEHRCTTCGVPLPDNYKKVKCLHCCLPQIRADRIRLDQKLLDREIVRREREQLGLCVKCNRPRLAGYKYCEEHYKWSCEILAKAREKLKEREDYNDLVHFLGRSDRNNNRRTRDGISDSTVNPTGTKETPKADGEEC